MNKHRGSDFNAYYLAQYRERIATEIMGWRMMDDESYLCRRVWMRPGAASKENIACAVRDFRPDEDVAQAIQVLEALAAKGWRWAIESWLRYDIQLQPPDAPNDWTRHLSDDGPLPAAIITAVVKSKGWDE